MISVGKNVNKHFYCSISVHESEHTKSYCNCVTFVRDRSTRETLLVSKNYFFSKKQRFFLLFLKNHSFCPLKRIFTHFILFLKILIFPKKEIFLFFLKKFSFLENKSKHTFIHTFSYFFLNIETQRENESFLGKKSFL